MNLHNRVHVKKQNKAQTEASLMSYSQKNFFTKLILILFTLLIYRPHSALALLFLITNLLQLGCIMFKASLFFIGKNINDRAQRAKVKAPKFNKRLPRYSMIVPLYKEAAVLAALIRNLSSMNYSKEKLQILIVIEEDDQETLLAYQALNIPRNFQLIIVPDTQPKTKPKACNYALNFANGEYITIYDAEDVPDPDQLLKVLEKFRSSPSNVACIQARLTFYNERENILTHMFYIEYTLLFDYMLPALEKINTLIPLGGTSNHFKAKILKKLNWDSFNVTEDVELAIRLKKSGYQVRTLDSYTFEEAPIHLWTWIKQRTRWLKGFIQTYFKHTQELLEAKNLTLRDIMVMHFILIFTQAASIGTMIHILCFFIFQDRVLQYFFLINASFFIFFSVLQAFNILKKAQSKNHMIFMHSLIYPLYLTLQVFASCRAILQLILGQLAWEKTTHCLTKFHYTSYSDLYKLTKK